MKETLIEGVRQAGALVLQHFGKTDGPRRKGNASDIVTAADLASERLISDSIRQRHPDHNLLGEEEGLRQRGSDITWTLILWMALPTLPRACRGSGSWWRF